MLAAMAGFRPKATMAIGLAIAAVYVEDAHLNGGETDELFRVDLAGGVTLATIPVGAAGPASGCAGPMGPEMFYLESATATNGGADLELVGTGCAIGQAGVGDHVRLEYDGFFSKPLAWSGPADVALRF
jgi:hypothetical protein